MKLSAFILFLTTIVNNKTCSRADDCKGKSDTDRACIELYKPVCGCDGKTYPNDCYAGRAGIKKWTEGECATTQ